LPSPSDTVTFTT